MFLWYHNYHINGTVHTCSTIDYKAHVGILYADTYGVIYMRIQWVEWDSEYNFVVSKAQSYFIRKCTKINVLYDISYHISYSFYSLSSC